MAIQACRDSSKANLTSHAAHAGVLLSTQLKLTGDENSDRKHEKSGKDKLFETAIEALQRSAGVYKQAFERWTLATSVTPFHSKPASVSSRLIIGLGAESVLETGITLHYTYGTPLIPGSALKGLAAHYCDNAFGVNNPELQSRGTFDTPDGKKEERAGHHYRTLFGTNESSGVVTFHDAWITPESIDSGTALLCDVMTTHHPSYYKGEGKTAPHDGEDPIPIPFLSVRGTFRILVEAEDETENGRKWCEFAMKLLLRAMATNGVGGKTSSGYGRLAT